MPRFVLTLAAAVCWKRLRRRGQLRLPPAGDHACAHPAGDHLLVVAVGRDRVGHPDRADTVQLGREELPRLVQVHVLGRRHLPLRLDGGHISEGSVLVIPCSPSKHTLGHSVYVEVQSVHHSHWVEDVEIKKPGATAWTWLKRTVTTVWVPFTPTRTGTYQIRSRLRRTTTGHTSGFSPALSVKVS